MSFAEFSQGLKLLGHKLSYAYTDMIFMQIPNVTLSVLQSSEF